MPWLVLFMTHVASCGAAVVTENVTNRRGDVVEIIDHTDPHLRRKLAKRLGMAEHPDDVVGMREENGPAGSGNDAGNGGGDDGGSCERMSNTSSE